MPDLRGPGDVTPEPNVKVQVLWTDQQIAETETKIKHLEADAEGIVRGKLKAIEAEIIMLKRKAMKLYEKRDNLEKFGSEEVVAINGTTVKRLTNQEVIDG